MPDDDVMIMNDIVPGQIDLTVDASPTAGGPGAAGPGWVGARRASGRPPRLSGDQWARHLLREAPYGEAPLGSPTRGGRRLVSAPAALIAALQSRSSVAYYPYATTAS
jgi:hypothetical protein